MAFVVFLDHVGWHFGEMRLRWKNGRLTAATLPEAETAVTARLDCRRAVLNIVKRM
jgi:hypothetical protein